MSAGGIVTKLGLAADPAPPGPATAARLADSLIGFDVDFWNAADEAAEWLADPFLLKGRGHLLYASAKTGKSLLALWVAASLATGRALFNQPAGPPVKVLYADMEMTRADVRERLTDMDYGPDDDMSNLHYYSLPALADLDTPLGGMEFVALAAHHEVDVVVIDTISRLVQGEENSNDTAQNFAKYTGTPLKAAGVTVLRVDHAGKDVERGSRGGSAKVDDPDVVWHLIARDRGTFTLKATHRRISWVPEVVELRQHADPLRYTLADSSWPAGTKAAAITLDRLQVPHDYGKGKARAILKDAGETMGNEVLMAALRYRRSGLAQRSERDR